MSAKHSRKVDAAYPKLAKKIMEQIQEGIYRPGTKLPGVRVLAEKFGVGRMIVVCALDLLTVQGYLYPESRKGFYVNPDIKLNRHNRIGCFCFKLSPMIFGPELSILNDDLLSRGYEPILGSDFEDLYSLETWLGINTRLDGILFLGEVSDDLLSPLAKYNIPYYAHGCYDIAKKHPQTDLSFFKKLCTDVFAPAVNRFHGKRIACITGDSTSKADRIILEIIQEIISAAGDTVYPELFVHAGGSAHSTIHTLLNSGHPDVIFVMGFLPIALARYFSLHPDQPRPYIIGPKVHGYPRNLPKVCDEYLPIETITRKITLEAVQVLLKNIES